MGLRRATPLDRSRLMELIAAYCVADGHDFDHVVVGAGLDPLLAGDAHGIAWAITDVDLPHDGRSEVVGYAITTWGWSLEAGGLEVLLDEIYVSTPGRGLGAEALREIEADMTARGARRITLETERHNERARSLYLSLGYDLDDSTWMAKWLPPREPSI